MMTKAAMNTESQLPSDNDKPPINQKIIGLKCWPEIYVNKEVTAAMKEPTAIPDKSKVSILALPRILEI